MWTLIFVTITRTWHNFESSHAIRSIRSLNIEWMLTWQSQMWKGPYLMASLKLVSWFKPPNFLSTMVLKVGEVGKTTKSFNQTTHPFSYIGVMLGLK